MRRVLLSAIRFLLFLPLAAGEKPVFTSASAGVLSICTEDAWYLEECDALSRPVSGTLWKKGAIAERTSWMYDGDSQNPAVKIVTGAEGSVETVYGATADILSVTKTNLNGETASRLENAYTPENLLAGSTLLEGGKTTETDYRYDAGRELREKRVYVDGELTLVTAYESADNRTETVYSKSVPVLTVTYENGTRKKDADEKKH